MNKSEVEIQKLYAISLWYKKKGNGPHPMKTSLWILEWVYIEEVPMDNGGRTFALRWLDNTIFITYIHNIKS